MTGRGKVLEVETMAAGGVGLARLEGQVVFIPAVLPGELVRVDPVEKKKGRLRAELLEVLEPSPHRMEPACELFGFCGGCQLMHADYRIQPELKKAASLDRLLEDYRPEFRIEPSPRFLFYRDRVRFQLKTVAGRLSLGFFEVGSNRLVPCRFCRLLNPRINRALPGLIELTAELSGSGPVPEQMEVLAGTQESGLSVTFYYQKKPSTRQREILQKYGRDFGGLNVHIGVKGRVGPQAGPPEKAGLELPFEAERKTRLRAWPGVFTQVNSLVNRLLVKDVLKIAHEKKGGRILDLFSGLGNFSLPLAREAKLVKGVEGNQTAVKNAIANARLNGLKNLEFMVGDGIGTAQALAERGERFDLIVLDPPRAGARGLARAAAGLGASEIVYVSCHPAALGRDLAEFSSLGYGLRELTLYDMFPQTYHLEVMAWLGLP